MSLRYVEMYSIKPFKDVLRTKFCLGYDPFYYNKTSPEGASGQVARKLLAKLGVFYYRDTENSVGLLFPQEGWVKTEIYGPNKNIYLFDPPLQCYFYNVKVLYPNIAPINYKEPDNAANMQWYADFTNKWGDSKQWLSWSEEKQVSQVTPGFLRLVKTKENDYGSKKQIN